MFGYYQPTITKKRGFTLIELLMVMAIAAITLVFIVPYSEEWIRQQKLQNVTHRLYNALLYARNQAYLHDSSLIFKPTDGHWEEGAQLVDADNHAILFQWSWNTPGLKIQWVGMKSFTQLVFDKDPEISMTSGHFSLSIDNHDLKKITLNRMAHIHLTP